MSAAILKTENALRAQAALREAIHLANLKPEASGAKLQFLYIDLRGPGGHTPDGVAARIMAQLRKSGMLRDLLGNKEIKAKYPFIEVSTWFNEQVTLDLLLTMLEEWLATAGGTRRPIPVIVFGESSCLHSSFPVGCDADDSFDCR